MVSIIKTAGIVGIDAYIITAECFVARGLPACDIVGLPDAAVKEARDRVRAAIKTCGYDVPMGKITVNLAPADVKKEGAAYDLPVFLSILISDGQLNNIDSDSLFIGELSLDGNLRSVKGILSIAMEAEKNGFTKIFLPSENAYEASFADKIEIYAVDNVRDLISHLKGIKPIEPFEKPVETETFETSHQLDFADVLGQGTAKRAIEVAVAGGHNILLNGSPGSGKSMMAKRVRSIMPPLTKAERLEVIKIYSALGQGSMAAREKYPPLRSPHHTTSAVSLAGGGTGMPKPGEVSLAHNGVLFLDEFPEFNRSCLEILRQPLEDGEISISRAAGKITYPSSFMLICAMNPCKCGWYGHPSDKCTCSPNQVKNYLSKISGPLLDRIDLQVTVATVEYAHLKDRTPEEPSSEILKRVLRAREIQAKRFEGTNITVNAKIDPAHMKEFCKVDEVAGVVLESTFNKIGLTARSYDRILRVARTIADLDEKEDIGVVHIAEALQFRNYSKNADND